MKKSTKKMVAPECWGGPQVVECQELERTCSGLEGVKTDYVLGQEYV